MPQFEYNIVRSKKITSATTITISEKKGVIVRAPFWVPEFSIRNFLEDRSAWVMSQIEKLEAKKKPPKSYEEGESHLFFGREYPLKFNQLEIPARTKVAILEGTMQISIYSGHNAERKRIEIREAILRLYLEEGVGIITQKVNQYCDILGVVYTKIELKQVSSIWGSCSASNKLSFNRKLVMAPHEIVDYVVIHEVCHMIQRNHSSRFWALVAKLDPNYMQHRRWLRDNHSLLTI